MLRFFERADARDLDLSCFAGMRPPERYSRDVWDELARQKRLVSVGHGIFELPPE